MKRITEMLHEVIASGKTQVDIEELTGISQPTISKWLRGRSPKSADHALTIQELHAKLSRKRKPSAQRGAKRTPGAPAVETAKA